MDDQQTQQPTDGRPSGLALADGSAVDAALSWVEADPLDCKACDEASRAMHRLAGIREWWPISSAPAHVLDNAASHILAAEVRRLRAAPDHPGAALLSSQNTEVTR